MSKEGDVNKEGGDGEGAGSEESSLLSYTLGYVSLTDLVRLCREEGGRRGG